MFSSCLHGYSSFLPQCKHIHIRLIGDAKLTIGVNVSVNAHLSLCISPVIDCGTVKGVSQLPPYDSRDRQQL